MTGAIATAARHRNPGAPALGGGGAGAGTTAGEGGVGVAPALHHKGLQVIFIIQNPMDSTT